MKNKKKNRGLQFTIEDVNLNYLGEWKFMKTPKTSGLVEGIVNSIQKYYIIYSEEIEPNENLIVEELTEKEFNHYKKKYRYAVHSV